MKGLRQCVELFFPYKGPSWDKCDFIILSFLEKLEEEGKIKIVRQLEPYLSRNRKPYYILVERIYIPARKSGRRKYSKKLPWWDTMRSVPLKRFASMWTFYPLPKLKMIPKPYRARFIAESYRISEKTARDYLLLMDFLMLDSSR